MPTTAELGAIAKAKALLRTSLSRCWHLQRWTEDTWTEAQTLKRIYLDALPPPPNHADQWTRAELQQLRPFALVYKSGPISFQLEGEPASYTITGEMTVMLEQNVPADISGDPGEIDRRFENLAGQVIATFDDSQPGLIELSKVSENGNLRIHRIEDDGPYRVKTEEEQALGDHQRYFLLIRWGSGNPS